MAGTRDRIIDATLELVTRDGLSAVTMVDVARTAGVARATLYNHYPDVPSILADAVTHHDEQAVSGLRQALSVVDSPTGTIEQLVRYVGSISSHGHTLHTHHGLPPGLRDRLSDFDRELGSRIRRALIDGTAGGELRATLDPATDTRLIRHMLDAVSELVAESPDDAADVVRHATETILAAIVRSPGT